MSLQGSGTVACPHCDKPLEVAWEVYRVWDVVRTDAGEVVLLDSSPPPFEGGICDECQKWVEPKDLA